jgi:proteasome lid subunit RPN8/RPN11
MVWAEVYAGGIGGFVGRLRPNIEPPPHEARRQYLAWCQKQNVPWQRQDADYGSRGGGMPPAVADDGDVGVIAAHASRMAIDALLRPEESLFPHPAYVIGLQRAWIFDAPFDTRPIDFIAEGSWAPAPTPERTADALEFMASLSNKAKMRIELAPDIEKRVRTALRTAGRREIGGMLFAEQSAPGKFRVIDFSLDLFSGSHTAFRRDPRVHRKMLDEFFERTGHDYQRFNYLGEWHSHPSFSVRPSAEDVDTMTDIVKTPSSAISFAILLIVRLRFWAWLDHSVTVFARDLAPSKARISPRVVFI